LFRGDVLFFFARRQLSLLVMTPAKVVTSDGYAISGDVSAAVAVAHRRIIEKSLDGVTGFL
jgi:hypothetical protein